jgi:hypothetical protein
MTRNQALLRLKKVLGPTAYATVGDSVSSPEKRDRYRTRRASSRTVLAGATAALDARRKAILDADTEYQQLLTLYRKAKAAAEDVRYHDGEGGYKFEVGTRTGIFRHPLAAGDTWEEVFDKLATKQK